MRLIREEVGGYFTICTVSCELFYLNFLRLAILVYISSGALKILLTIMTLAGIDRQPKTLYTKVKS